jgi:toxin ParE1/3/4
MIVRYHALARSEVIDVAEYYSQQRPNLGEEFLGELDFYLGQIAANPLRFEQVRPGIRRCIMHRFPYGIYFRMPDANTVRIIVVRHHGRRPGFGLGRI